MSWLCNGLAGMFHYKQHPLKHFRFCQCRTSYNSVSSLLHVFLLVKDHLAYLILHGYRSVNTFKYSGGTTSYSSRTFKTLLLMGSDKLHLALGFKYDETFSQYETPLLIPSSCFYICKHNCNTSILLNAATSWYYGGYCMCPLSSKQLFLLYIL